MEISATLQKCINALEMSRGVYLRQSRDQNVLCKMGIWSILNIKHFLFTKTRKRVMILTSHRLQNVKKKNSTETLLMGAEVAQLLERKWGALNLQGSVSYFRCHVLACLGQVSDIKGQLWAFNHFLSATTYWSKSTMLGNLWCKRLPSQIVRARVWTTSSQKKKTSQI